MTKFDGLKCFFLFLGLQTSFAQSLSKETIILETTLGTIKLKLYEETPLHKANFLKLVNEHAFDSLLFHRVIADFMIQGGDPQSKRAKPGDTLGNGEIGYTIPAEIRTNLIHKKGALCAAREGDDMNPKFESSACQFYIVEGKVRTLEDLKKAEDRINKNRTTNSARALMKSPEGKALKAKYDSYKVQSKLDSAEIINKTIERLVKDDVEKLPLYAFSDFQKTTYSTIGGTPHLDGTYTVFGEVIEGLAVVDKIAKVKTNSNNRPISDVRMKMRLEK